VNFRNGFAHDDSTTIIVLVLLLLFFKPTITKPQVIKKVRKKISEK